MGSNLRSPMFMGQPCIGSQLKHFITPMMCCCLCELPGGSVWSLMNVVEHRSKGQLVLGSNMTTLIIQNNQHTHPSPLILLKTHPGGSPSQNGTGNIVILISS